MTPSKVAIAAAIEDDEIDEEDSLEGGPDAYCDKANSPMSFACAALDGVASFIFD